MAELHLRQPSFLPAREAPTPALRRQGELPFAGVIAGIWAPGKWIENIHLPRLWQPVPGGTWSHPPLCRPLSENARVAHAVFTRSGSYLEGNERWFPSVSKAKEPLGCERILFRNIQIPSVVFEYGAVKVGTCTAARWSAVTSHRFPRRRVLPRHLSTACGTSHVCSVWFESQHGGKGERRELGACELREPLSEPRRLFAPAGGGHGCRGVTQRQLPHSPRSLLSCRGSPSA